MTKTTFLQIADEEVIAVKKEIIETGSYLAARHYHAGLAGNISARISGNRLLCTRHGADKGALRPDDFMICDLDGGNVSGHGALTSEFSVHRMAYRERPDISAVIHAHPPTATAFAAASVPLDQLMLPEMIVLLGPVALVPYATPGTEELARQLQPHLDGSDSFLLENHGALTIGTSLRDAMLRMELLEHNAQMTLTVRQIGKPFVLSPQELAELMEIRKRLSGNGKFFG